MGSGQCICSWGGQTNLELRNCELLVGGVAVVCNEPSAGRLVLENCIVTGNVAVGFGFLQPADKKIAPPLCSVTLVHNTFRNVAALSVQFEERKIDFPQGKETPVLIPIQAIANAFDVDWMLRSAGHPQALPSQAGTAKGYEFYAYFGRIMSWKGARNAYRGYNSNPFHLSFAEGALEWTHWQNRWGNDDRNCLAGGFYYKGGDVPGHGKGADLQPRLTAKLQTTPEKVVPDDFRAVSGSAAHGYGRDGKDLGADVDLVGPGPALERWQRTPGYSQWIKNTEQVLAPR
jgi:hypothetical protein